MRPGPAVLLLALLAAACGEEPRTPPAVPVAPPATPPAAAEETPAPVPPVTVPTRHPDRPAADDDGPWGAPRTLRVVRRGDGTPVPGALVRIANWDDLVRAASDTPDPTRREGRTDADGRVDLPVPRTLSRLAVRGAGLRLRVLPYDDLEDDGTIRVDVATGHLTGRVERADDATPVPGARVRVWSATIGGAFLDLESVTDADGRFELSGVDDDERVRIGVVADGFAPAGPTLEAGARPDDLIVRLGAGATLRGRVERDGAPAAGATVVALEPGSFAPWHVVDRYRDGRSPALQRFLVAQAQTGDDGRFTLRGLATGSDHRLVARDDDGAEGALEAPLRTESGDVPDVVIPLAATGTILVRVTHEVAPPDGRRVTVTRDGERGEVPAAYEARRGKDGDFVLGAVPAGSHDVLVRCAGAVDQRLRVRVEPGATATVDALLRPGVTLTGRLRRSDGSAVAGAYVAWSWPGDDRRPAVDVAEPTDADGAFTLAGLPEVAGRLTANAGALTLLERADVQAGQDLGDLTVAERARVAGRLTGVAPADAVVHLGIRWPDGRSHETRQEWPGADATVEFDGVPLGERVHLYVFVEGRAAWVRRDVTVESGTNLELGEIVFPEPAHVTGVVRRESGAPLPKATVWLSEPWFPGHATADERGRFTIGPLPPGRSAFRVEIGGVPRAYRPVRLVAGEQTIDLVVKDQGQLVLVLKLADGRPAANVDLDLFPLSADGTPDLRRRTVVTSNASGVVSTAALVGAYGVRPVEGSERTFAAAVPDLRVEDGKTTRVELIVN